MSTLHRLLPAVALAAFTLPSLAAPTTVFTSSSGFLAFLNGGGYTENFNSVGSLPAGPAAFSGNGFSFSVSAPADLVAVAGTLGTSSEVDSLTITFGSGVNAFGGNFFASDFSGGFWAAEVALTLSDGTVETFSPSSFADSYRGFVTTADIASVTFTAPTALFTTVYATIDNLTISHVPEPGSFALVALAAAGLFASRRRAA